MKSILSARRRMAIALLSTLGLAACGGGEEDSSSSNSGPANPLSGTWYSSAITTSWTFSGGSYSASGTGTIRQRSYDGTSCRITDISYTVNSSAGSVSYYVTRAAQTTNGAYDYNQTVYQGPYSASYTLSGGGVKIGTGTYSAGSRAC